LEANDRDRYEESACYPTPGSGSCSPIRAYDATRAATWQAGGSGTGGSFSWARLRATRTRMRSSISAARTHLWAGRHRRGLRVVSADVPETIIAAGKDAAAWRDARVRCRPSEHDEVAEQEVDRSWERVGDVLSASWALEGRLRGSLGFRGGRFLRRGSARYRRRRGWSSWAHDFSLLPAVPQTASEPARCGTAWRIGPIRLVCWLAGVPASGVMCNPRSAPMDLLEEYRATRRGGTGVMP